MSKKIDKTKYTEESIISLNPREFTRLRPATYLGSNEYSTQLLREVFSNALDEHLIGHGNKIEVTVDTKKNTYSVKDFGQGFPINVRREDGETILQAAFDVLNTSGKYDDDGVYSGSVLGLNGVGSKLVTFLSTETEVSSYNEGGRESVWFKDGIFLKRELSSPKNKESGTVVKWHPDPQFFQNPAINLTDIKKLFEDIAALCPELTISLIVDGVETVFHSEHGLQDLVDKKTRNKEVLPSRFSKRYVVGNELFDICLTYTSDYSDNTTAYVNYGLTESGIHINTVKSLFTKQVNKYALDKGFIKKEADEFSSQELSEGLFIIFNLKAVNAKYDSQTKSRVVDINRTLVRQVMNNDFGAWLANNSKEAKVIIDRALCARKAREAAQKAKDGIRNAGAKGKKFINLPTKLVDAYSKNRGECELFITEGDSAANGLIAKRNGKTQAVFPIRGKILSCRKATPDKVYANQEISNIVKAIGLDIEKETGKLIYDKKKLRYEKIILAADGDSDGLDIRLLLINMFWWLCPELVINGHICAAIPPLFRVTTKKNEYIYLIGEKELADYKKKHKKESFTVNRNKGLGEMDSSELAYCLLNTETRNIQMLRVEDAKEVDDMLEMFMGDKVAPRRDYLLANPIDSLDL